MLNDNNPNTIPYKVGDIVIATRDNETVIVAIVRVDNTYQTVVAVPLNRFGQNIIVIAVEDITAYAGNYFTDKDAQAKYRRGVQQRAAHTTARQFSLS